MKRIVWLASLALVLIHCNDDKSGAGSENDVDAARNFIRASLDRDWLKARQYLLADSANVERMDKIESFTSHENKVERSNYREASITLYETRNVNDSVSVITYSNSYKKQKDSLRVVKLNGQWLVDLKYTILPPLADSLAR